MPRERESSEETTGTGGHPRPSRPVDEFAVLYQLTDKLYLARSLAEVYDAALDVILAGLGCPRASVLLFDGTGVMRFVAWRGLSDSYRTALGGPPVSPPMHRGFGSRLVERTLAQDLDARVMMEFRPEGLVCSINAPVLGARSAVR